VITHSYHFSTQGVATCSNRNHLLTTTSAYTPRTRPLSVSSFNVPFLLAPRINENLYSPYKSNEKVKNINMRNMGKRQNKGKQKL